MIIFDMRKHSTYLVDATSAYAKAIRSSVRFLIVKNERMAKELHMDKKIGELVTASTQAKLKKEIIDEVLSLDTFMWAMYSKFGTVHKPVVHVNGWQQRCARRAHMFQI